MANQKNQKPLFTKKEQIIRHIEEGIAGKEYRRGDVLPSVNKLGEDFGISRLTVMSAYRELQSRGIIASAPGKGYFLLSDKISVRHRVFVLFDELNAFKEDLYNAFIEGMGSEAFIDIYFHHFNKQHFIRLINESLGKYTSYVIMPVGFKGIWECLKQIPSDKLFLLDQRNSELPGEIPVIFQDFEKDTYEGLNAALSRFIKYHSLILSPDEPNHMPAGIITGFEKFCKDHGFRHKIESIKAGRRLKKGEVYFLAEDRALVYVILEAAKKGLVPGKDIGIIVYNETALRQVIANGISTISTDFVAMGSSLANLVKGLVTGSIRNPGGMILRNSL